MEDAESLRVAVKEAELLAAKKSKELDRMTADMRALNDRVDNLVDELNAKTEQYNEIIHELDDFAKKQNREDEKELLQQLAARDQELFELQEARKGESGEHEKEVSLLQDQINRLREQLENERNLMDNRNTEEGELRDVISGLENELKARTDELEELQDAMDAIVEEHEADMRELEDELERKAVEASDALERLEEMTTMLKDARESELIGIQRRTESDAEIFRLQREVDHLKRAQYGDGDSFDN
ncbi:hypothetical protein, conserved [Angomonas deanei]|uniref:Uncharacterized protein n=1 Tax=Angomonas deanei TaxID=59799 RepID=A0A7G2C5F3_9TRYP|nr:hypothetical protein, conserved [Angomonas deanei]